MRITEMVREATGGDRLGKAGAVQEFADRLSTTSSTVSRWRNGVIPGPQWRQALAKAFEVSEDEIEKACGGEPPVTLEQLNDKLERILALLERKR